MPPAARPSAAVASFGGVLTSAPELDRRTCQAFEDSFMLSLDGDQSLAFRRTDALTSARSCGQRARSS